MGGTSLSSDEVLFLFGQVARVDMKSFLTLLTQHKPNNCSRVEDAFDGLPADSKKMLERIANEVSASGLSVAQWIHKIDENHDGRITPSELEKLTTKLALSDDQL